MGTGALAIPLAWVCVAATTLAACASAPAPATDEAAALKWSALGWLSPGASGEPEVIGFYATEAECRAAVDDWMSRQVVGNPVSGDCLPVDRR
jgi:hypothetical protein